MMSTFGRVPLPSILIRDIPSNINTAWDDLGPRTIRAVVWHRMLGSLGGTDTFFRGEGRAKALTDYGIGVAAIDGANAGKIYRWNDPKGRRSPWANGRVSGAYGDGAAFVDLYGTDGVNRDATAIEISGMQTTPLDDACRESIIQLTAYWADQYRVSWETFPAIPAEEGRSFVIWHQEFTIGTGKECPFSVVMGETDALIAATKAYLKSFQEGSGIIYPAPAGLSWKRGDLGRKELNGIPVYAVEAIVTAKTRTTPRAWASEAAPACAPLIERGLPFVAIGSFKGSDGNGWVVREDGARVRASHVTPKLPVLTV